MKICASGAPASLPQVPLVDARELRPVFLARVQLVIQDVQSYLSG